MSSVPDDLLAQIESGEVSAQILEFVARGLVPLPAEELVRAVASVIAGGDAALAPTAEATFRAFDAGSVRAAVLTKGIRPEQIGPLQDIIITNQVRLLEAPLIVERLFENPRLSAEIRRRADEFLEEFFLKKEREKDEAAAAAAAAAPSAPEPEAPAAPEVEEERELSEDEKKSLFARVSVMSVVQRIRLAYRGNKEERMFLVQDRNRLVSAAVLKSPKTREADAETIANMKSVSEDVLRTIAFRRDWMRHYGILRALVRNPRSPIDVTLGLVIKLNAKDMKLLSSDRNVPEAVRASARREVARKES